MSRPVSRARYGGLDQRQCSLVPDEVVTQIEVGESREVRGEAASACASSSPIRLPPSRLKRNRACGTSANRALELLEASHVAKWLDEVARGALHAGHPLLPIDRRRLERGLLQQRPELITLRLIERFGIHQAAQRCERSVRSKTSIAPALGKMKPLRPLPGAKRVNRAHRQRGYSAVAARASGCPPGSPWELRIGTRGRNLSEARGGADKGDTMNEEGGDQGATFAELFGEIRSLMHSLDVANPLRSHPGRDRRLPDGAPSGSTYAIYAASLCAPRRSLVTGSRSSYPRRRDPAPRASPPRDDRAACSQIVCSGASEKSSWQTTRPSSRSQRRLVLDDVLTSPRPRSLRSH